MEDILAIDLPDPDAPTRQEHEHAFKAIGEAITQELYDIPAHVGLRYNNLSLENKFYASRVSQLMPPSSVSPMHSQALSYPALATLA